MIPYNTETNVNISSVHDVQLHTKAMPSGLSGRAHRGGFATAFTTRRLQPGYGRIVSHADKKGSTRASGDVGVRHQLGHAGLL
jgi:hypothetical protein